MKIAIASGKGGTGKTTVATNLAWLAARAGADVAYVDCDVDEPNGHLFLKPIFETESAVCKLVPEVDPRRCTVCGECSRLCQFHAIVCLGSRVLVYPELCHGCGGCRLVCPQNAIAEVEQTIGSVSSGRAGDVGFVRGLLRVGETRSLPVIRAAKQAAPPAEWVLLDAPPGTSCPAVETVRGCDFVLLVTEPTPFGLHDLRLAVDVAKTLKLACGVVINRALVGQTETRQFCQQTRIPVLGEIPDSMAVAEACSEGQLAVEAVPGLRRTFAQLLLRFAFLSSTSALPEAVRRNLKEFAEPGGEPSSTMSRTLKASSPAVCYLALKKRSQPETASRASPSPEK